MEGQVNQFNALGFDFLEKVRGEVEASCWGSCRAIFLGVDGLVAVLVFQLFMDIGWQGHVAQAFQNLQENAIVGKLHNPSPVVQLCHDGCRQATVPKAHNRASLEAFGGLGQDLPLVAGGVFEEEELDLTAGIRLVAIEAGGQDPGVVHDQGVARVELVNDVVKAGVGHGLAVPVDDQEAGGIPLLQRCLGNQVLGQVKIKIFCVHAYHFTTFCQKLPMKALTKIGLYHIIEVSNRYRPKGDQDENHSCQR